MGVWVTLSVDSQVCISLHKGEPSGSICAEDLSKSDDSCFAVLLGSILVSSNPSMIRVDMNLQA